MTTRFWLLLVVPVLLCQASAITASEEADAAAIRREYEDWLRAYEQKDLNRTVEIFGPEAISTFAGAPDNDFNAIRRSYDKSFAATRGPRLWKPVDMEIGASGDLAYALADWQLFENGSVRLTNRSIDVLKRTGETWKIIRSFTIPKDGREIKPSCEIKWPSVSPETFTGKAREVWQRLMRWKDSYNAREVDGTMAPYDPSINGLYAGNQLDTFSSLRDSYTRSFAAKDRQRTIEFEPEEILTSGEFAFVRDHWTSTLVTPRGESQRLSRGIEFWRKNAGDWKLLRYLSYLVCDSARPK